MDSGHPGPVLESASLNGRHGWRDRRQSTPGGGDLRQADPGLSPEQGLRTLDAGALSCDAFEGGAEARGAEGKSQQASLRRPER